MLTRQCFSVESQLQNCCWVDRIAKSEEWEVIWGDYNLLNDSNAVIETGVWVETRRVADTGQNAGIGHSWLQQSSTANHRHPSLTFIWHVETNPSVIPLHCLAQTNPSFCLFSLKWIFGCVTSIRLFSVSQDLLEKGQPDTSSPK